MIVSEDDYLAHYGILRKSGRYPWGSGGTPEQNSRNFLGYVRELKKQGLSEKQIAEGFGLKLTGTDIRDLVTIANSQVKAADISQAQRLKDKGMHVSAIARTMDKNESVVRALLRPGAKDKSDQLESIVNKLKEEVAKQTYIDVGSGVEGHIGGISAERLRAAVTQMRAEGYVVHPTQLPTGVKGRLTTTKVLAPAGTTYRDVKANQDKIGHVNAFSPDNGRSWNQIDPPLSINSKRVSVVFKEDGGDKRDGLIYVRPGVKDLSMGGNTYAQVRIAVDNKYYIKGMALQKDDLPDGVDLVFHSVKSKADGKLGALKKLEDDPENPFGSIVRQIKDDKDKVVSAMNIVNDDVDWAKWNNTLSSQFLSKQSHLLAKRQLDDAYSQKREVFEEINGLTNPTVKRKLLEEFADSADASAVHLKAAAMPRQKTQVLIPLDSLKDTEVYAPNFNHGERVVLVRFPHGGTFEIPELTVNTNNREGKRLLGSATTAIGINSKVAARLSGADFDGDTVLVIPNTRGHIKTTPALIGLKNFDAVREYPAYPGMPQMKPKTKQNEMGRISNLINDMTIRGATDDEKARAVRHSMVVIDAEKKHLNYKLSAINNGIPALIKKYQAPYNETGKGGASTLISRKKGEIDVPKTQPRGIDPITGKVKRSDPETFTTKEGVLVTKTMKVPKLLNTDDANTLSSGTQIEKVYAGHSNRMRALADEARKTAVNTPNLVRNPSAAKVYDSEVKRLDAALSIAERNRPLERQAQIFANTSANAKKAAHPDMEPSQEKKMRYLELEKARKRVGAKKEQIEITPREWEAIQAGAISDFKLKKILNNANLDVVKAYATPKVTTTMTSAKQQRATTLLNSGLTQAEVASILNVSVSTLKRGLTG